MTIHASRTSMTSDWWRAHEPSHAVPRRARRFWKSPCVGDGALRRDEELKFARNRLRNRFLTDLVSTEVLLEPLRRGRVR